MNPRRAVRPRLVPPPRGASGPCDAPPPPAESRLSRPPHPLLAIVFLYVVAEGVLWGAFAAPGDSTARSAVAYAGLCLLLVAAVHWIEAVELRHVPAKLGLSRARPGWWAAALLAGLPAWIAWALALRSPAPLPAGGFTIPAGMGAWGVAATIAAVACGSLWQEAFFRGFAFRGLMRRHGFATSAGISAALLGLAVALEAMAGSPLHREHRVAAAVLELPLSFALCQLFWLAGPSLGPTVLVRLPVIGATLQARVLWPMGAAALVLLVLGRLVFPRWASRS